MKLYTIMRNTGIALLSGVALLSFAAVATGCSDNEENGLYAADGSNIGISIEANGASNYRNGLLELGSAQSATPFSVTSTTRWVVEVSNCEGAWCQIVYGQGNSDAAGHIGDGSFTVEAAPNRSGNSRECTVTVYAIESDGTRIPGKSVEFNVEQDRQSIQVEYAGDVISPFGTNAGTRPTVTVTANQAWTVSTSHSWITIIPGSEMDGDTYTPSAGSAEQRSVSFSFSVDANPGTATRYAEVTVSSPTSAFTPIRLNVTQEGSSETFFVTPSEVPLVMAAGGEVEFQVYSPRDDWQVSAVSAGNWVSLDRTSGTASNDPVTVRASVRSNSDYAERQAAVIFTHGSDRIETVIYINQERGATPPETPDPDVTPAVSQAWIMNGWTATRAIMMAYYNSPYHQVVEAGAVVQSNAGSYTVGGYVQSSRAIVVELDGLTPNTQYTVYPFIVYRSNGFSETAYGEPTSFVTPDRTGQPGTTPGVGDNTPPSAD